MDIFLSVVVLSLLFGAVGTVVVHANFRRNFIRLAETQAERLEFLAQALPLKRDTQFPLRANEEYVYQLGNVMLVEPRRAARVSRRTTDAVTVALARGVYYTAAGGKSVSPEPGEEMRFIDHGKATFTTQRVVFVGAKQTREWDFAKLLGWDVYGGGRLMIAVSNRQKVSGIQMANRSDLMPDIVMQITGVARDEGWDRAREVCKDGADNAKEQARFVRDNPLAGEVKIAAFVEKLDEQGEIESAQKAGPDSDSDNGPANAPSLGEKRPRTHVQELDVVGEFFYADSFAKLRELFSTDGGTEHIVEADLRNDPDNPYSDSGMAVAVFIRDLQVGHIPESIAPDVFHKLEAKGGRISLGARLWLDHEDARPNKSSVTIYLDSRLA